MTFSHSLSTAIRVLRSEGSRAFLDRTADRLGDRRRTHRLEPITFDQAMETGALRTPVLNLASRPPSPRLGGVAAQWLARIEAERRLRPMAVAYQLNNETSGADRRFRLELLRDAQTGWRIDCGLKGQPRASTSSIDPLAEPIARSLELTGASIVHVENPQGLPFESLAALPQRHGIRLILSIHDFGLWCRRAHLFDGDRSESCGASRDSEPCLRCFTAESSFADGSMVPLSSAAEAAEAYRRSAESLLAACELAIFPSTFMRDEIARLFPAAIGERFRVIAPASARQPVSTTETGKAADQRRWPPKRIALLGAGRDFKGGLTVLRALDELYSAPRSPDSPKSGGDALQDVEWIVYGGGEAELLQRFRRLPSVTVRGYYRSGALSRHLLNDRIDLAILASAVPESYSMVFDECVAAGVPTVVTAAGALCDPRRSGAEGAFGLASLADSSELAEALSNILGGSTAALVVSPKSRLSLPTPESAARGHLRIYRDLGASIRSAES